MIRSQLRIYQRRLPHWRAEGATYFVTWRVGRTAHDLEPNKREIVAEAIPHFDGEKFRLHAFVVMNDHAHVLASPIAPNEIENLVQGWKSYTTSALWRGGRKGKIWQREYFDRIIRSETDYLEKMNYILGNPWKRWPELEEYPWVWSESMGEPSGGGHGGGGHGGPPLPDER
jgi:REP element-mobilizing transposase RayT